MVSADPSDSFALEHALLTGRKVSRDRQRARSRRYVEEHVELEQKGSGFGAFLGWLLAFSAVGAGAFFLGRFTAPNGGSEGLVDFIVAMQRQATGSSAVAASEDTANDRVDLAGAAAPPAEVPAAALAPTEAVAEPGAAAPMPPTPEADRAPVAAPEGSGEPSSSATSGMEREEAAPQPQRDAPPARATRDDRSARNDRSTGAERRDGNRRRAERPARRASRDRASSRVSRPARAARGPRAGLLIGTQSDSDDPIAGLDL